jgi:hypothetical protein
MAITLIVSPMCCQVEEYLTGKWFLVSANVVNHQPLMCAHEATGAVHLKVNTSADNDSWEVRMASITDAAIIISAAAHRSSSPASPAAGGGQLHHAQVPAPRLSASQSQGQRLAHELLHLG